MDGLSIITSIVTLLGACSTVFNLFERIRRLRHVPELLFALSNEVNDLRLVLLDVQDRQEELEKGMGSLSPQETRILTRCEAILKRTWDKVHDTEWLLRKILRRNSRALSFLSQELSKLTRLQEDIRVSKQSIQNLWSQLDLRQSVLVQVQVQSILETSIGIQDQLHENVPVLLTSSQRIERKMDNLINSLSLLQSGQSTPSISLNNSPQMP